MNITDDVLLPAQKKEKSTYQYQANTLPFIDDLVQATKKIIEAAKNEKIKPVIMIDGPAGTGKSSFARDLVARCRENGINVCYLEQDNFGMDRWKRGVLQINSCADISRDPVTVEKVIELMETGETKIPEYNFAEGTRIPDKKSIKSGDIIVYEGVSALSSVVYDNYQFNPDVAKKFKQENTHDYVDYRQYVPIRIFFKPASDTTVYISRLKRDSEERGVDAAEYDSNWDNVTKNNWLYTMRGLANANVIVTRDKNDFIFNCTDNISFKDVRIKDKSKNISGSDLVKTYMDERRNCLKKNERRWFGSHYVAMKHVLEFENTILDKNAISKNSEVVVPGKLGLKKPNDWRNKIIKQKIQIKNLYLKDINNSISHDFIDDGAPSVKKTDLNLFYKCNGVGLFGKSFEEADIDTLIKRPNLAKKILQHDIHFNNKVKLGAENALAAVVLDNAEYFIDSVRLITNKLLEKLIPVFNRYVEGDATESEMKLVEFVIAPFSHTKNMIEMGRVTDESKPDPSNGEIISLLLGALSIANISNKAQSLFTHMRFCIRIGHLIADADSQFDRDETSHIFGSEMVDKIRSLSNSIQAQEMFSANDVHMGIDKSSHVDIQLKRGRLVDSRLSTRKTNTFGTFESVYDVPDAFKKFIGRRFLSPEKNYETPFQSHTAGKIYMRPIPTIKYNKQAFDSDLPMISSVSGAMRLIIAVAKSTGIDEDQLKKLHLVALATIIGGGHHSLAESMAVSQQEFQFDNKTYLDLMPDQLRTLYAEYKQDQSSILTNPIFKKHPKLKLFFEFLNVTEHFKLNHLWIDTGQSSKISISQH